MIICRYEAQLLGLERQAVKPVVEYPSQRAISGLRLRER